MKKLKTLITGGTGYIGSHTAVELIAEGCEVEILDNTYNSKAAVIDQIEQITGVRPKFHKVDIRDREGLRKVFARGEFDAVLHFAGLKAVGESVEQPLKYYENNVAGTVTLLQVMEEFDVNRIVFSSSATVYGVQESPEYIEQMRTGQDIPSPYGRTKFMIEEIFKDVATANKKFHSIILRYFNPIGAHQSGLLGEDPNDRPNNLMPIIMKVATGEIPELSVYGDDYETPDGTCVRDYIHVVDLAKGHVKALDGAFKKRKGASRTAGAKVADADDPMARVAIYNLGSGHGTSVLEMVRAFSEASGKPLPHKIVERRAGDLAEFYANPAKAEAELGWKTELSIDDAMRDTLNYLRTSCGAAVGLSAYIENTAATPDEIPESLAAENA